MEPKIKFTSSTSNLHLGRFAGSLALMTVAIILLVTIVVMGRQFVLSDWEKHKTLKSGEQVLLEKKSALSSVSPGVFDRSGPSALAMPERNPLLWSISQIKSYLNENENIVISSFKTDSEATYQADIKSLTFTIVLESTSISDILDFVTYINGIAPITRISTIKSEATLTGVKSEVAFAVYWSPFPTSLSGISEPIVSISESETEILNIIAGLKQPAFSVLSPSAPSIRENPFN